MKWILVILIACAPDHRPAGNVVRIATKDQIATLDPVYAYDEVSAIPVHAIYDTLVDYEPRGLRVVPRLAERWDVDGLTYRFYLRDAICADGAPATAGDVAAALQRARDTADSPFGPFLADVADVRAVSARELDVTLARESPAFLYVMTMSFTAPRHGDAGCGPYEVASWDPGRQIVLRRSAHYWDPARAHLDEIVLHENIPRDLQFLMFERGELDAAERLSAPDYRWLVGHTEWAPYVHRVQPLNSFGSRMDVRQKPFDDRRVRQALNYALDKQHSIKLLAGTAVAANGLLPPGLRDEALAPYPHDPARARALLADAGYPHGFAIDYVIMNDDEAELLAQSMQSDLAEVGVRLQITEVTFEAWQHALDAPVPPAFSKATWLADYPDPGNFFDPLFHSGRSTNNTHYELDALLDQHRYREAEAQIHDDAPWIFDYHQELVEVTQPYVRGYELHPIWLRDYTSAWIER